MTNEEKKALKDCDIIFMCLEDMMSEESANNNRKSYKIIRNLIETQQKEIEELKEKNEKIEAINYSVNKNLLETTEEIEELKKDKLELINKYHVVHLKDVEKELREMRKAIDTKNAEIECLNVIHESYKEMVAENNYISKDKIKAILKKYGKKEIEDAPDFYKEIQSLLEEE